MAADRAEEFEGGDDQKAVVALGRGWRAGEAMGCTPEVMSKQKAPAGNFTTVCVQGVGEQSEQVVLDNTGALDNSLRGRAGGCVLSGGVRQDCRRVLKLATHRSIARIFRTVGG